MILQSNTILGKRYKGHKAVRIPLYYYNDNYYYLYIDNSSTMLLILRKNTYMFVKYIMDDCEELNKN